MVQSIVGELLDISGYKKEKPFYIAHRFDRVIIGECNDENWKEAAEKGGLLELHIFNSEKEIFFARTDEGIEKYDELEHKLEGGKDCRIGPERRCVERKYELDGKLKSEFGYEAVEVVEYIGFDDGSCEKGDDKDGKCCEYSNLAYIEKTVLKGLIKIKNKR